MKIAREELLRLLKSGCAVTPHQIQAAERIEELESALPEWIYNRKTGEIFVTTKGHHITDEQIDAAVAIAEKDRNSFGSKAVWYALNKLNIHRCEGCYSCMDKDTPEARNRPDCNGHGWVIGGDDE